MTGAARHGDPAALELVAGAGRLIGETLATLVNFFDPSLLLLGGAVAQDGDVMLACVRETVYRRSLPLATRDLRIMLAKPSAEAGLLGASAMVTDELFSREAARPVARSTAHRSVARRSLRCERSVAALLPAFDSLQPAPAPICPSAPSSCTSGRTDQSPRAATSVPLATAASSSCRLGQMGGRQHTEAVCGHRMGTPFTIPAGRRDTRRHGPGR